MPTYAGNGVRCGLDSDSDGYPDVQLNCPDQSCEQVKIKPIDNFSSVFVASLPVK